MSAIPTDPLLLPPPQICRLCGATKLAFECPSLCCGNGSIQLAPLETPPYLQNLFTRNDDLGTHFRTYCRAYNSNFAFTSLGGNISASNAKGFFTFILRGQLYHYLPHLVAGDAGPKYMQLYFYDGASEFDSRHKAFDNLRPDLVMMFISMTSANPYARFFRSLRSFPITGPTEIRISTNPMLDQRIYNAPTSNDVAAIIVDDSSSDRVNSPHIIVHGKSNEQYRVLHYFGCYDPLQYPLLFTRGETGWHQGLKRVTVNNVLSDESPLPIAHASARRANDIFEEETIGDNDSTLFLYN